MTNQPEEILRCEIPQIPIGWDTITTPQLGVRGYTYSHYRADEVSSSAQKAVRRCYPEEAVQWFMEMYWTGAAMRTNIWNRALVMAVEDIGPADPMMIHKVNTMLQHYKDNPVGMAITAYWLAQAPKSRVNDWAVKIYPELNDANICNALGTPEQLKAGLIDGLTKRDTGISFYYAKALFFCTHKIKGKYKNAQWYIWQAFDEIIGSTDPYLTINRSVGMDPGWRWRKRCRLLHIHVIHLWCNHRWPTVIEEVTLPSRESQDFIRGLAEQHLRRERLVGVPDYALDKHTIRGKQMNRGLRHFIDEGSLLNQEDTEWKVLSDHYLGLIHV